MTLLIIQYESKEGQKDLMFLIPQHDLECVTGLRLGLILDLIDAGVFPPPLFSDFWNSDDIQKWLTPEMKTGLQLQRIFQRQK
jgi:hypothetical protein